MQKKWLSAEVREKASVLFFLFLFYNSLTSVERCGTVERWVIENVTK